jgi:hypothetical protein
MTTNITATAVVLLTIAGSWTAAASRQVFVPVQDIAALHEWTVRLDHYVGIRAQAAEVTPPPAWPASFDDILRFELAFAAEIRARRTHATMGDLFTANVGRTFRKLIAHALTEHEIAVAALLDEFLLDVVPGASRPTVNHRFSWQLGTAMPACLLDALPKLPKGLQYRLVGRDLILLDIDANLVVDILPAALPRPVLTAR